MEALDVLRCTRCDAPLTLADAESVTCASCGAENPVPAAYRELHRARVADQAGRAEAERLLRSLDRPPRMATKVLARTFDQNMFAFLVLYGVPVGLGAIFLGLRADVWIAHAWHYASPDDVPFGYTAIIIFAALFVLAFVPRALGVYANRRVADRAKVLSALAAKPPNVPGSAAQCRMCGAPLAVEPDRIVAVCSYCRAENAVHLETKLVAKAGAVAETIGREVREAAQRDREERMATSRLLRHELARYLVRTVLLGGSFVLACQETPDRKPTTAAIVGIIATAGLFLFFMLRSMMSIDEDAAERRAGNDAPSWIGVVGPLIVLVVLYAVC
ncbi:MAG: hypothetical protein JO257_24325 [Deltaproteobacteria bacterium]|nr:hypothetical protein [Deltaproteobacteria bacterium]